MRDTTDTGDRTEAPVSNEELYVRLGRVWRTLVLVTAGIFAGFAYLAAGTSPRGVSLLLAVYATLFLVVYFGVGSRNVCTRLLNLVPGKEISETFAEEEARLTDDARADGGEER